MRTFRNLTICILSIFLLLLAASPVPVQGKVCTTAEPTTLFCLDADTGALLWSATNDYADTLTGDARTAHLARVDGVDQTGGVDRAAHEAGSTFGVVVVIDDGVVEPADVGDDGDRAVGHGLHLGQAARLEPARHQQQVGAGEDQVAEGGVVAVDEADPARVGLGQLGE